MTTVANSPTPEKRLWTHAAEGCSDPEKLRLVAMNKGMTRLVSAIQELSLARDLEAIMRVVRRAAREITGCDGATFVLRDGDLCYYADEDAIVPLWKGQRFPMSACISGWAMLNRTPAVIEDIYADPRIPADAYRLTFVKSLAMVPIRTASPIGAIGNYWATRRTPTPDQVELLQALANTTAVAMENVEMYRELEKRVEERTAELEATNRELEAFSYAVSHDLSAPVRRIRGYSDLLLQNDSNLSLDSKQFVCRIQESSLRMSQLIDDLLRLSTFSRSQIKLNSLNLSDMASRILEGFFTQEPGRNVELRIQPGVKATADAGLASVLLENLLSNAWKYTSKQSLTCIEFGTKFDSNEPPVFFVKDNGAGFDPRYAEKLFQPFQRFHTESEFPGVGVGLATVRRIVERHGGRIWCEAQQGKGATFSFTLAAPQAQLSSRSKPTNAAPKAHPGQVPFA